jgi:hypothetical protein
MSVERTPFTRRDEGAAVNSNEATVRRTATVCGPVDAQAREFGGKDDPMARCDVLHCASLVKPRPSVAADRNTLHHYR